MLCFDDQNGGKVISVRLEIVGRALMLWKSPLRVGDWNDRDRYIPVRANDAMDLAVAECNLAEFDLIRKHGFSGGYRMERLYLAVPSFSNGNKRHSLLELVQECQPVAQLHPEVYALRDDEWAMMPGMVPDHDGFFDAMVYLSDNWK